MQCIPPGLSNNCTIKGTISTDYKQLKPHQTTQPHKLLLKSITGLDFWCTRLALLKPHLHTEKYDDTWFV